MPRLWPLISRQALFDLKCCFFVHSMRASHFQVDISYEDICDPVLNGPEAELQCKEGMKGSVGSILTAVASNLKAMASNLVEP